MFHNVARFPNLKIAQGHRKSGHAQNDPALITSVKFVTTLNSHAVGLDLRVQTA